MMTRRGLTARSESDVSRRQRNRAITKSLGKRRLDVLILAMAASGIGAHSEAAKGAREWQ
jgi:hypothetical protein